MKQFAKLLKSKNYDDHLSWSAGDIGTEAPVFIAGNYGKDIADLHVQNKKMWGLVGEEGGKIVSKLVTMTRKKEIIRGWIRRDLSYSPKK